MVIEIVPLSQLKPADYNPRTISEAAFAGLRESIARFGLVQPIVWNRTTGNVVSGHQRLKALLLSGESETTVVVVELPESEEKLLNIAQNADSIRGEFDPSALARLDIDTSDPFASLVLPTISDLPELEPFQFEPYELGPSAEAAAQGADVTICVVACSASTGRRLRQFLEGQAPGDPALEFTISEQR